MKSLGRLCLVGFAFIYLVGCTTATWHETASTYFESKNYSDALYALNKVIEQDPQSAVAYYNRGLTYSYLNNYQQAIKDYNKAIELNPQYTLAYNNRSLVYRKIGDYQLALKDANKAIEQDPKLAIAYYNRGLACKKLDKYAQAIADYKKAIELDMQYAPAHNDLAWLYATAKNKKFRNANLAIEYAERALELSRENHSYTDTLAAAYAEAGRFGDAIAAEEKAITVLKAGDAKDISRISRYVKRLDSYKEQIAWTE